LDRRIRHELSIMNHWTVDLWRVHNLTISKKLRKSKQITFY
jgi:hypothetical protein